MSRGLKNNNPGNIRHDKDKWRGEIIPSRDSAFKQFESMAWGYRAMFHLINNYARLHGCNTISKIISRYAPPVENHTDIYIKSVSEASHVPANTVITTTNKEIMVPIIAAMSRVENGKPAVMSDVEAGWNLFVKYR